jgi:hypothetical protein
MNIFYRNSTRQQISRFVLVFYIFIWSVNIFHHHHIDVRDDFVFSTHSNPVTSTHNYSYDNNVSCTVHSNYVSLASLKIDYLNPDICAHSDKFIRLLIPDQNKTTKLLLSQNNLRAPPLS